MRIFFLGTCTCTKNSWKCVYNSRCKRHEGTWRENTVSRARSRQARINLFVNDHLYYYGCYIMGVKCYKHI